MPASGDEDYLGIWPALEDEGVGLCDVHPGLREVTGDMLNAEAVAAAVPGHDAVIRAPGHRP